MSQYREWTVEPLNWSLCVHAYLITQHYGQNFEKSWNLLFAILLNLFNFEKSRKIYYHSIEEHPKISKIAKFGCETL